MLTLPYFWKWLRYIQRGGYAESQTLLSGDSEIDRLRVGNSRDAHASSNGAHASSNHQTQRLVFPPTVAAGIRTAGAGPWRSATISDAAAMMECGIVTPPAAFPNLFGEIPLGHWLCRDEIIPRRGIDIIARTNGHRGGHWATPNISSAVLNAAES